MKRKSPLSVFLGAAVEFIPSGELSAVLSQFGITGKPTVKVLNKAVNKYGDEFIRAIADAAKPYIDPKQGEAFVKSHKLNKGTGKSTTGTLSGGNGQGTYSNGQTTAASAEAVLSGLTLNTPNTGNSSSTNKSGNSIFGWFSAVVSGIGTIGSTAGSLVSIFRGDTVQIAKTQEEIALAQIETEKTTRTWIGVGIAFVAIVFLFFVGYKMFGKNH